VRGDSSRWWLLLAVAMCVARPALAATEAQVKAAYLIKLAAFVRGPQPSPASTFRICTFGRPDISASLAQLARGQRLEGKPIELAMLDNRSNADVRGCRVLFVGRAGDAARGLMAAVARAPVLVVTDRKSGTRSGVVEFVEVGGRVRLAVDRANATVRQLELSSKLLDIAVEVGP
jgi:hypothetical protein